MRIRETRMPFGKHRGKMVKDIPADYLWWVWHNVEDLRDPLRQAIHQEIFEQEESPDGSSSLDIDRWYRTLAVDFHRDRRKGNCEAMKAIERANELLRSMLH